MPLLALASAVLVSSLTGPLADGPAAVRRGVDLEWNPMPGCPRAAELHDDLDRLSTGTVRAAADGRARAVATVRAGGEGFVLALAVHDGDRHEQRTLEASDCRTLARAAVLLTVVTLAPVEAAGVGATPRPVPPAERPGPPAVTEQRPGEVWADEVRRPEAPEVTTRADRPAASEERARPHSRARIGALAGPAVATAPALTVVVGGELGWTRGAFGLLLRGWHAFAVERFVDSEVGVRASVSAGGLHARYAFGLGSVVIPLSVGVELGVLSGSGVGERVVASETTSPWGAGVAGAGLEWPAKSRVAVRLSADAVVMLIRPGIHLRRDGEDEEVFRAPSVGARVLVGPVLRLP